MSLSVFRPLKNDVLDGPKCMQDKLNNKSKNCLLGPAYQLIY